MSYKFSPKFTLTTAYPMMFSSDDLRYIETEMLHTIFADSESCNLADPAGAHYFDTIETPIELYRSVKRDEFQRMHRLRCLERLWEIEPDDCEG